MKSRLHDLYDKEIIPKMMDRFNYKNVHQVPKLKKLVVNMRIGKASKDDSLLKFAMTDLAKITGQRPVITNAKKSVSNFGIKKGDPVGCRVTLRKERMFNFLDKLINVALPRIRDFSGLKKSSFDGYGNYSLGLSEQAVFPELEYDEIKKLQGMDITISINSNSDEESLELLKLFGMRFKE